MKTNKYFIKLLLLAVLCDFLILAGFVLIDINVQGYNSTMNFIGFIILWFVFAYVSQHELKLATKRMNNKLGGYEIRLAI